MDTKSGVLGPVESSRVCVDGGVWGSRERVDMLLNVHFCPLEGAGGSKIG